MDSGDNFSFPLYGPKVPIRMPSLVAMARNEPTTNFIPLTVSPVGICATDCPPDRNGVPPVVSRVNSRMSAAAPTYPAARMPSGESDSAVHSQFVTGCVYLGVGSAECAAAL